MKPARSAACASATWAWPKTVRTKPTYTQGIDIKAKTTVLGEGARGHLSKQLIAKFKLDADCDPQSYSIGIKELWQVREGVCEPGKIVHTMGWPADSHTYGGSFLYHLDKNRIALGYVSGLDYSDPNYQPYEAFQQWKNHPQRETAARRRHDSVCRCARHRDRRLPEPAEGGNARRLADRLFGRPGECAENQRRASGHPLRHAGRRTYCRQQRFIRLGCQAARFGGGCRTEESPQFQTGVQERPSGSACSMPAGKPSPAAYRHGR